MAFPDNCTPRILTVEKSTGCTLTRASINGMTPQVFENQDVTEVGMDKVIERAKEAKTAGYIENTLESLLFSRLTPIKDSLTKQKISASESIILPYIYRRQKRNINSNWWAVNTGAATPGAGSGGIPASAWNLTVQVPFSTFSSALVNIENYFLPGKGILIETVNATTKTAISSAYKIIASANGGTAPERAVLTLEPNVSATAWAGYTASQKAAFQLTTGTVIVMANSVSDYESWCHNEVAENTNKLLTYWMQTSRFTHEFNDEYLKALNNGLMSGYWKTFRQLPLAEQKRIQHKQYMKSWVNSMFYSQKIDENQTVELYKSLPQVIDPLNPGCVFEYKSNALGFKPQLQDCNRYLDHQGNTLSVDFLAATGYDLKRAREADGGTIDTIDWMTDRFTAGKILDLMTSFYKAKYGASIERHAQLDQKLVFENQVALTYNVYQLPPELGGYNMAVFTDPFFDGRLAASTATSIDANNITGDQGNRARTLWAIDWTDVMVGIAGTSSAKRQTNLADDLYTCIIKANVHHYLLESTQWTTIIEDPNRHYIIDNFSDDCPTLTVAGCTV